MSVLLIFIFFVYYANCQTILSNVSCGSRIFGVIPDKNANLSKYFYRFTVDNVYNVNIDDCASVADIVVTILDNQNNDISEPFCDNGDYCGFCKNAGPYDYPENFTIPSMENGTYLIKIKAYYPDQGGNYELSITCDSILKTPNSTITYTTSTPSAFAKTDECDHYNDNSFVIFASQKLLNSVEIKKNTIYIQFDIKLNSFCNNSLCNILYIGNEFIQFPSISINGIKNYFQVLITNKYGFPDEYKIPFANMLLPDDNEYHHIELSYETDANSDHIYGLTFTMNDYPHLFVSSVSNAVTTDQVYPLYLSSPWHHNLNAEVKDLCVQTLRETLNTDTIFDQIEGNITCGETANGSLLTKSDIDYLYLTVSDTRSVLISSCFSDYLPDLTLYDTKFNTLYFGQSYTDCNREKIMFHDLKSGVYILEISGNGLEQQHDFGDWQIEVICSNGTSKVSNNESYVMTWRALIHWPEAEQECEQKYGTTLATIVTDEDMDQALEMIMPYWVNTSELEIVIGMYGNGRNGSMRWTDGTSCKVSNGDCTDHWYPTQPDEHQGQQVGTYLIPQGTDHAIIYDIPFTREVIWAGILCNAPGSKYSIKPCKEITKCWKSIDCCNDSALISDINDYSWNYRLRYRPPVAYYNSTLVIVSSQQIYYSKLELMTVADSWQHLTYRHGYYLYSGFGQTKHDSFDLYTISQQYAQYQSSLYLNSINGTTEMLIHIDMKNWEIEYVTINRPQVIAEENFHSAVAKACMVADEKRVFLITNIFVATYYIKEKYWTVNEIDRTDISTCAITKDYSSIYIFSLGFEQPSVIKYDTKYATFISLDTVNLCSTEFARAVTGVNGKMYLHGCYVSSWQTLIFNPKTETFEEDTVDIDVPINIADYRYSQLAVIDDNIILSLYATNDSIDAHFAITELISINMEETELIDIWPSDGLSINYRVNDFSNATNGIYEVNVALNISNIINTKITLNTTKDNCICNENNYKCYNCSQQLILSDYLSVTDNSIYELSIVPSTNYDFDVLIIPDPLISHLLRCIISFDDISDTTTSDHPYISFGFFLSDECYTRIGAIFVLDIIVSEINIFNQLNIEILNDNDTICQVCDKQNNCISCDDGDFFIPYDVTDLTDDTKLDILIKSRNIDFHVISPNNNNTVQYLNKQWRDREKEVSFEWTPLRILLVSIGGGIFCLLILAIIYLIYWLRKQYMNVYIVDEALVLIIGISQFNDKTKLLSGVAQNVVDLVNLWGKNNYNYDVFVCKPDTLDATKQEVIDFVDLYIEKLEEKQYQSVIIHGISHGDGHSLLTADMKYLEIDFFFHEFIEKAKETGNVELMKLMFYHACMGNADYHIGTRKRSLPNVEIKRGFVYGSNNKIKYNDKNMTYDSNHAIISGNIHGRAMSDYGDYAKAICKSFLDNLNRWIKWDFDALIKQIGCILEQNTNHAELCNINGTIRHNAVRFEKCKDKQKPWDVNNDAMVVIDAHHINSKNGK